MAVSSSLSSSPDFTTASRLIPCLQASILPSSLPPASGFAQEPWQPVPFDIKANPYHRTRLLQNVEHARILLLRLDNSAQEIKVQSLKRDIQKRIADWRLIVKGLKEEIEEWGRIYGDNAWYQSAGEVGVQKEDLLAKYGGRKRQKIEVSEDTAAGGDTFRDKAPETLEQGPRSRPQEGNTVLRRIRTQTRTPPPQSPQGTSMRRRRNQRDEFPDRSSFPSPRAHTSSSSTKARQQHLSSDAQLAADATTQLTLTESLATLATQLRLSSSSIQNQLAIDKDIVNKAADGLDKNVTGMEAAGKRMGALRRMSEGKGWWGRIMLYAWIMGLWVVMILLVGVGPKMRF